MFDAAAGIGAHVVIAGGAAVHYRWASDVDVFVLQQPWTKSRRRSLAEDCDDLMRALGGEAPMMDAETYVNADGRGQFYRAGKVGADEKPIHVIGWRHDDGDKATTPVKLLETFDLSIHAWAVDETGRLIGCDDSTDLESPIRILHKTPTTAERLVKLTERYFPAWRQ